MSKKSIEMTVRKSLLLHLSKNYSAVVSTIETRETEETTNLSNTILQIIRHIEINKRNEDDLAEIVKVLAAGIPRGPKRTCTTQEYIDRGSTAHLIDRYYLKHPELHAKYCLRHMITRG